MNTDANMARIDSTPHALPWSRLNRRFKFFWLMLVIIGLLLTPVTSSRAAETEKERYIQSIITILRLHSDAIRQLATHNFKYSRNLVRHVSALQYTFGMIGPMEWHAKKSIAMQKTTSDTPTLSKEDFDKMADQCQKSMKGLYQISLDHLEKKNDPTTILKALDDLQGQCTTCHKMLDDVNPNVWGHD